MRFPFSETVPFFVQHPFMRFSDANWSVSIAVDKRDEALGYFPEQHVASILR